MKKIKILGFLLIIVSVTYSQSTEQKLDTSIFHLPNCQCTLMYKKSLDTIYTKLVDKEIKVRIEVEKYYIDSLDVLEGVLLTYRGIYDFKTGKTIDERMLVFKKDRSKYKKLMPLLEEYAYKKIKQEVLIREGMLDGGKGCPNIMISYITVFLFPEE